MLGSGGGVEPGLGGCLLGQPPAFGCSGLAWLCGGRRDAACLGWGCSFSCSLEPGVVVRDLRVETKISVWDACPARRHRSCL